MKPISETAFYCCGARMLDATSKKPVANDIYAKRFMGEQGMHIFKRFRHEWIANAACVMRHRIIDDAVSKVIQQQPNISIILIGAGFDTRAFRHKGGNWFEIDEYQLIDYKNRYLPITECVNPLQRFSVDFSNNELDLRLKTIQSNDPVLFIIEGVFMYLNTQQTTQLLNTIGKYFPEHDIYCDLLTKRFQQFFGQSIQRKINAMGNRFVTNTSPEILFKELGYTQNTYTSIVKKTLEGGALPAPKILARTLPAMVESGYGIYQFKRCQ